MSDNDMKAELERLRSENAALKKGASSGIRLKVSEKGAVSVYGMGRFPVTLYKEHRSNEASKRLDEIPGIGPALATALVASVAVGHDGQRCSLQGTCRTCGVNEIAPTSGVM